MIPKSRKVIGTFMLFVLLGLSYGNVKLGQLGDYRTEKVMRYARMIDTGATHSQVKVYHHYNTYGVFVDRETGKRFTDHIGDSLYRQFERGGNKPIEVSWPYSIDMREQTSIGVVYDLCNIFGWLAIVAALLFTGVFTFREKKETR